MFSCIAGKDGSYWRAVDDKEALVRKLQATSSLVVGLPTKSYHACTQITLSRSFCRIVVSWYVDSLVRGLRNYAKKLLFKVSVR